MEQKLELVGKSLFEQVTMRATSNKSREHFVSLSVYPKVFKSCRAKAVRTLLALVKREPEPFLAKVGNAFFVLVGESMRTASGK